MVPIAVPANYCRNSLPLNEITLFSSIILARFVTIDVGADLWILGNIEPASFGVLDYFKSI